MNRKQKLIRAGRKTERATKSVEPAVALPPVDPEPQELALEVFKAFVHELERYRRTRGDDGNRLDPRDLPTEHLIQWVKDLPDQDMSFFHLERLAKIDPALMRARWDKVKATAGENLESGYLAARALEFMGGEAWPRAVFLAVRRRLHEAWRPRHGGETALLDEMAQYEVLRLKWVGILSFLTQEPATINALGHKFTSNDGSRNISKAQATLEALRLVERLQQLYQNALRALMSMRRGKTTLYVRNTGPMSVAGTQINGPCTGDAAAGD